MSSVLNTNEIIIDISSEEEYGEIIEILRKLSYNIYENTIKEDYEEWPNLVCTDEHVCGNCTDPRKPDPNGRHYVTVTEFRERLSDGDWRDHLSKQFNNKINEHSSINQPEVPTQCGSSNQGL